MRIVVVSEAYSKGMGYTENCLPKALADLGHEVHLVTSVFNVYGCTKHYGKSYERYLGPARLSAGRETIDGYTVHRLNACNLWGYIATRGLSKYVRSLKPDIIQMTSTVSLTAFQVCFGHGSAMTPIFAECHQHMSVVKPYLKEGHGPSLKRLFYYLTRTVPGRMAARDIELCYAITPDCAEVAAWLYGVPRGKVVVLPLGTDTSLFSPDVEGQMGRDTFRASSGVEESDVLCIFTGRLQESKNPCLLADAIGILRRAGKPFRGLFIGDGPQREELMKRDGCTVHPFVLYKELARYYHAADVAVWPREESMSMLDAAATGLPIVVGDKMGDMSRVEGNGLVFQDGDAQSLASVLATLSDTDLRQRLGGAGIRKMEAFSWTRNVERRLEDYKQARELSKRLVVQ